MIVTVAIHHPKGPQEEVVIMESLKRYGEEQKKHKGLVLVMSVKDKTEGYIVGMSIWDSKENYMAAREDMAKTFKYEVNFVELEDRPNQFIHGEPVYYAWPT